MNYCITCVTSWRRADTEFLLKFLRTSKFSQLRARTMIKGYLALKVEMPQSYTNWDPLEPQVARFFQEGWATEAQRQRHYYYEVNMLQVKDVMLTSGCFSFSVFIPLPGYLGNGQKVLIHSYGMSSGQMTSEKHHVKKFVVIRMYYSLYTFFH